MASRSKNIVIVTHHYPPHITGVGFVAQSQAKRLAALGYNVTVITSKTSASEASRIEDGVNVVGIPAWNISETWGAPFPIFSPMLLVALFKYIRRADIVHIHDSFYMSSFFTAVIAKLYKKPLALTQHVAMIAHPSAIVMAVQKVVYATSGAVIFHASDIIYTFNDRVERFLIERGVPQDKMVPLPNGVDTEVFRPASAEEKKKLRKDLGIDLNKKMILFVGRPVPKKGFDKVLAARSNEYQIVCAGGDIPKEPIDNVLFLGTVDQAKLARVYQAADIFLLPSESEGFPLSVQEAMACGLPVITTNDEGYKRYDLDKALVYLIDHPNETSVRAAIASLVNDASQLKKMGAYSEHYAKSHFSWQLIMSKLDNTYDQLLLQKA